MITIYLHEMPHDCLSTPALLKYTQAPSQTHTYPGVVHKLWRDDLCPPKCDPVVYESLVSLSDRIVVGIIIKMISCAINLKHHVN